MNVMQTETTTAAEIIEPEKLTPLWRVYANMLLARQPEWNPDQELPAVVFRQHGLRADSLRCAEYRRLCGEGPPDLMPPVYPHILATPLQLNLLASEYFPLPLAGLVHMGQEIEWYQTLPLDTVLDVDCRMHGPFDSDFGWEFVMETEARAGGELVWRECLRFLKPDPSRRTRPKRRGREGDATRFVPLLHLQFPEDTGRRYARVSGDWNPIHLWQFTARRFGFRKPIAHGMFTLARCLAVLEARGVRLAGMKLEANFRAPVMLPAFTNFSLSEKHAKERFALTDARKGRILLEGRLSPLRVGAA